MFLLVVLGTAKNQCWWAGHEAIGNFLKELGIVPSDIIGSKCSGGKQVL